MNKYKLGVVILAVILAIGLVLWLIGAISDEFNFTFGYFVTMTLGAWAVFFVIANLVAKQLYGLSILAVACAFFSLLAAVLTFEAFKWYIGLIVFFLFAVVVFALMFAFKKGWDAGDNNKPGYEKYQRKDGK